MASSGGSLKLTQREQEIASLAVLGLTCNEIAAKLVISPNTVKTHLFHIYDKLGVHRRMQLVRALERIR